MVSLTVWIVIQCQFEMIASCPELIKIRVGIRLVKKAYEIIVFT